MFQLFFKFPSINKNNSYAEDDFLELEENLAAVTFLDKFFIQKDFSRAQFQSLIIKGEECCGKTHLVNIYAKKFSAEIIDKAKISDLNLVDFFQKNKFYILDEINEIKDEELLLHLINSAIEAKAFLVITAHNNLEFKLKDLVSRLKNIFSIQIKDPNLSSMKELLSNGFARKQIKLSSSIILKEVIRLFMKRLKRSKYIAMKVVKIFLLAR